VWIATVTLEKIAKAIVSSCSLSHSMEKMLSSAAGRELPIFIRTGQHGDQIQALDKSRAIQGQVRSFRKMWGTRPRRDIVGQQGGHSLGKRHIFAEKGAGELVLGRDWDFKISPNEKFVVAEDVLTRSGRVQGNNRHYANSQHSVMCVGRDLQSKRMQKPDFWLSLRQLDAIESGDLRGRSDSSDLASVPAVKPGNR
jgi:hypothetical protein